MSTKHTPLAHALDSLVNTDSPCVDCAKRDALACEASMPVTHVRASFRGVLVGNLCEAHWHARAQAVDFEDCERMPYKRKR